MIRRKIKIFHIILITGALLCGFLSRAQLAFPADYHFTNSPTIGSFRLIIGTTNEYFAKGQPIFLTIAFENISTNDAPFSVGFQPFIIDVCDSNGNHLPKTEIGKQYLEPSGGGYFGLTINKDVSYTDNVNLTGYFYLTNAGGYYITVQHRQNHAKWSTGPLKIIITRPKELK